VVLKTLHGYSQQPIIAFNMQTPFKFWSAAHNTRHLILAPKGHAQENITYCNNKYFETHFHLFQTILCQMLVPSELEKLK
jgi:hypothetical protein